MEQYRVILKGTTPLLMHNDNLAFSEKIRDWCKAPENKEHTVSGDDRTPPWTWIGYLYHDHMHLGVASDNLMTMLREGGAKVLTGKGKETYKKQTQSGIIIDGEQFDLFVDDELIDVGQINPLIGEMSFPKHLVIAEELGFELLVKRARIGRAKHVRVRPMFRHWTLKGSFTVLDSEMTGLTHGILQLILDQAGVLCGLCDWRPSSPSSGTFGKFEPFLEKM